MIVCPGILPAPSRIPKFKATVAAGCIDSGDDTKKHGRPKATVLVVQSCPLRNSRTKLCDCGSQFSVCRATSLVPAA